MRGGGGGTEVKVSKNGRLGWGKQELYCLIKLFYRTHIPVRASWVSCCLMQLYKPLLLCIIFFLFVFRDLLPTLLQYRRLRLLLSYCKHFLLLLSPTALLLSAASPG